MPDHVARQRLRAEHGAEQVHAQHRAPRFRRHIENWIAREDTGIIDETEHTAEALDRVIRRSRDLRRIGNVYLTGNDIDSHLRT